MIGNLIQILDSSKNYIIFSSIGNNEFYIKRNGIYIKDNETENIFRYDLEKKDQFPNHLQDIDSVIKVYENLYGGVIEEINNSWAFLATHQKKGQNWKPVNFLNIEDNWRNQSVEIHYVFDQMYGGYLFQIYTGLRKKIGNAKNPEDIEERIINYFKRIQNRNAQMLLPPPKK